MSLHDLVLRARRYGYSLVGLADLVEKYEALEHLRAGEPGRTTARRDEMRSIASRFPASLRELDENSREELAHRAEDVAEVLRQIVADLDAGQGAAALRAPARTWMRAAAELHAYLRELLKVKRWLAGRPITEGLLAAFAAWHTESGDPRWSLEHWTAERLGRITAPPRGQVTQVAYEDIAARHGVTAEALRRTLYPGSALAPPEAP